MEPGMIGDGAVGRGWSYPHLGSRGLPFRCVGLIRFSRRVHSVAPLGKVG